MNDEKNVKMIYKIDRYLIMEDENVVSREEYERMKKERDDLLIIAEKYNKHKEEQKKEI